MAGPNYAHQNSSREESISKAWGRLTAVAPPADFKSQQNHLEILDLKTQGWTDKMIADELGIAPDTIRVVLRDAAKDLRSRFREVVQERFMPQDGRLEELYRLVRARISIFMELDGKLGPMKDEKGDWKEFVALLAQATVILTRSSALWGLDAKATKSPTGAGGRHGLDWADGENTATEYEIVKEAERLMPWVRIPKRFDADMAEAREQHERMANA